MANWLARNMESATGTRLRRRAPGRPAKRRDMAGFPRSPAFDDSIALLREGYGFISRRCDELGSDAFATRLMLAPVICMRGADAASIFYHPDRFGRRDAMPAVTLRLLQDKGSVQQLEGPAHRQRKAMFLSLLLAGDGPDLLIRLFREEWRRALPCWQDRGSIRFFDEVSQVLTRAVTAWVGMPDDPANARLCGDLMAMIENPARVDPRVLLALLRRRRTEARVSALLRQVRTGAFRPPAGSPLEVVAAHRDADGQLLDPATAAVEIINLLRPLVAVGRYLAFTALALHDYPQLRSRFAQGDEAQLEGFVEEIRRLAPFFPCVGGRVRQPFSWKGHDFEQGDWVLLDLYGTNHDPARFDDPGRLDPSRAANWREQGFDFVPQGGGPVASTHRCPGEAVTVGLMTETVRLLTRRMSYTVPPQNLTVDHSRIPSLPRSGIRMERIRAIM